MADRKKFLQERDISPAADMQRRIAIHHKLSTLYEKFYGKYFIGPNTHFVDPRDPLVVKIIQYEQDLQNEEGLPFRITTMKYADSATESLLARQQFVHKETQRLISQIQNIDVKHGGEYNHEVKEKVIELEQRGIQFANLFSGPNIKSMIIAGSSQGPMIHGQIAEYYRQTTGHTRVCSTGFLITPLEPDPSLHPTMAVDQPFLIWPKDDMRLEKRSRGHTMVQVPYCNVTNLQKFLGLANLANRQGFQAVTSEPLDHMARLSKNEHYSQ